MVYYSVHIYNQTTANLKKLVPLLYFIRISIEKVNNYEESQSTVKTMFSHTHPKLFASSVNKYSAEFINYLPGREHEAQGPTGRLDITIHCIVCLAKNARTSFASYILYI